jgi:hypothetical protein
MAASRRLVRDQPLRVHDLLGAGECARRRSSRGGQSGWGCRRERRTGVRPQRRCRRARPAAYRDGGRAVAGGGSGRRRSRPGRCAPPAGGLRACAGVARRGDHVALLSAFAEMGLKLPVDMPHRAMEIGGDHIHCNSFFLFKNIGHLGLLFVCGYSLLLGKHKGIE